MTKHAVHAAEKPGRPSFEELPVFWQGYIEQLHEDLDQVDTVLDRIFRCDADAAESRMKAAGSAVEEGSAGRSRSLVEALSLASARYVDRLERVSRGEPADGLGDAMAAYRSAARDVEAMLKGMLA